MAPPIHLRLERAWTNDPAHPVARTVTTDGDRVVALDAARPAAAEVIDTGGYALPGFIDAHVHFIRGGLSLTQLDLASVRSRAEFEAAIADTHATLPDDAWLIARGWSQENWPGHALPDRRWLAAAGARPTVCYRKDEHAALVNDAVLARCDLTTPIKGGSIARDRDGEPTGLMIEAAAWHRVNPLVPRPSRADLAHALDAAETYALDRGITTVGSMEYRKDVEAAYLPRRTHLRLRHRITLLDRSWPLDPDVLRFARTLPIDDRLAVIGAKSFLDGTLGLRTAAMLASYADAPET
ncbi:MAG: amidohydrolase family protein, partial [Phycisphaerae bacterium]|nr:amidohydrolase family protein [Phycisphaerae bacterium]